MSGFFNPAPARIEDGDAFADAFVPPDWLIDGVIQRGRVYTCTSLTGHGKTAVWLYLGVMVQSRRKAGQLETEGGNVLILAGENPEDLRARMNGMRRFYPGIKLPRVLPGAFPMNEEQADALRQEIRSLGVNLAMVIGDTAASFFPGDDEDDNVEAGAYARTLRTFTLLPGSPAVILLAHPVKRAARDNLLPRGGGAFMNEIDGNTTLWSPLQGEQTVLHWQGKIRGPDFNPITFRLLPIWTGHNDRKGRQVMTIIARPMDEEEAANQAKQALANEDVVLKALHGDPGVSLAKIAADAGWIDEGGNPERWKVQRAMDTLAKNRMVKQERERGPWSLTEKGERVVNGSGAKK